MPSQADAISLSAGQRGKIRRLSQPKELSPDEEGGELNIVPFLDIIVNILIFVLATVAVTFTATIHTSPPAQGGPGTRKQVESSALNLTVLIVNDGFSLKASGGNIAPGCEHPGPGVTIPKAAGKYDYDALGRCAAHLKAASPDFQTIVSVMDAVRSTPAGDVLFDDVHFKVPR